MIFDKYIYRAACKKYKFCNFLNYNHKNIILTHYLLKNSTNLAIICKYFVNLYHHSIQIICCSILTYFLFKYKLKNSIIISLIIVDHQSILIKCS